MVIYDKFEKKIFWKTLTGEKFYIDLAGISGIKEPWYLAVLEYEPKTGALLFKTGDDFDSDPYIKRYRVLKFRATTKDQSSPNYVYGGAEYAKYYFDYGLSNQVDSRIDPRSLNIPLAQIQLGHPSNAQKGTATIQQLFEVFQQSYYCSCYLNPAVDNAPVNWNFSFNGSVQGSGYTVCCDNYWCGSSTRTDWCCYTKSQWGERKIENHRIYTETVELTPIGFAVWHPQRFGGSLSNLQWKIFSIFSVTFRTDVYTKQGSSISAPCYSYVYDPGWEFAAHSDYSLPFGCQTSESGHSLTDVFEVSSRCLVVVEWNIFWPHYVDYVSFPIWDGDMSNRTYQIPTYWIIDHYKTCGEYTEASPIYTSDGSGFYDWAIGHTFQRRINNGDSPSLDTTEVWVKRLSHGVAQNEGMTSWTGGYPAGWGHGIGGGIPDRTMGRLIRMLQYGNASRELADCQSYYWINGTFYGNETFIPDSLMSPQKYPSGRVTKELHLAYALLQLSTAPGVDTFENSAFWWDDSFAPVYPGQYCFQFFNYLFYPKFTGAQLGETEKFLERTDPYQAPLGRFMAGFVKLADFGMMGSS